MVNPGMHLVPPYGLIMQQRGFGFYKKHSGKVSYILASKKKINNIQCVRLYTV